MTVRTGYENGQFCWIDLLARDMDAARHFYGELFGWESTDVDTNGGPPYAQFLLSGKRVAGMGQMSDEMRGRDRPASWNSYLNVDNIAATCVRVSELGGKVAGPAVDIQGVGKLAFIQDPTGAQVGLWQKGGHFGAELTQDFHCCCWNELLTRDIAAAREFYGRLFGWEFVDYTESDSKYYVVSHHGEESCGLMQMDERWGEMPPSWTVYFAVKGVDLMVDYVRQLGGFVLTRPYDIPEGRLAMVTDSQGGLFDVVEMTEQPQEEQE